MKIQMTTEEAQRWLDCFPPEHSMIIAVGQAIGADALRKLMEVFPAEHLYIQPWDRFCAGLARDVRNAEIALRYNGRNGLDLADEYGLTPRTIRKIANRGPVMKDSSALNVVHRSRCQPNAHTR